jgi:hypothetical protein
MLFPTLIFGYVVIGAAIAEILIMCDPGSTAAIERHPWRFTILACAVVFGWPVAVAIILWRRRARG